MGSFSMVGEYVGTWVNNAFLPNNVSRGTPFFQGGYIQVGYFLTGEHDVYDRQAGHVRPCHSLRECLLRS